jgi:uncharacterized membrane protein YagU involved in acid resistance
MGNTLNMQDVRDQTRIEFRYFLLSIVLGILILAALLFFCYTAMHQEGILGVVAYVLAFFLALPIFIYCGADFNAPVALLVTTALFDVLCLSVTVFIILLLRRARRDVQR